MPRRIPLVAAGRPPRRRPLVLRLVALVPLPLLLRDPHAARKRRWQRRARGLRRPLHRRADIDPHGSRRRPRVAAVSTAQAIAASSLVATALAATSVAAVAAVVVIVAAACCPHVAVVATVVATAATLATS